MFFFRIAYSEDCRVHAVLSSDGVIYFKAADLFRILGYSKPQLVVRAHCPEAVSLDVLLNRPGNETDRRILPFRINSKMLYSGQVYNVLKKSRKPHSEFENWFRSVNSTGLVCDETLEYLRLVNHEYHCPLPTFSLHPEGQIYLHNLIEDLKKPRKRESDEIVYDFLRVKREMVVEEGEEESGGGGNNDPPTASTTQVKREAVEEEEMETDTETVSTTTGVQTDTSCLQSKAYPIVLLGDDGDELEGIVTRDYDTNKIPCTILYKTKNCIYNFKRC